MYEKITLKNLNKGALEEKFQYELEKIKDNIIDLNTDYNKAREINIKIKFKPDEDRVNIACITSIITVLAPLKNSGDFISLANQNNKNEFFQETSKDIPLFKEDEKEKNQINLKEVINQ